MLIITIIAIIYFFHTVIIRMKINRQAATFHAETQCEYMKRESQLFILRWNRLYQDIMPQDRVES